jgi:hypothetical protein
VGNSERPERCSPRDQEALSRELPRQPGPGCAHRDTDVDIVAAGVPSHYEERTDVDHGAEQHESSGAQKHQEAETDVAHDLLGERVHDERIIAVVPVARPRAHREGLEGRLHDPGLYAVPEPREGTEDVWAPESPELVRELQGDEVLLARLAERDLGGDGHRRRVDPHGHDSDDLEPRVAQLNGRADDRGVAPESPVPQGLPQDDDSGPSTAPSSGRKSLPIIGLIPRVRK